MSDQPTVLIVDDEPQMRMVLSFSLETYGFTCLAAASAEEAMIILRDENVDVVLADVMLPGHSGLELCERIKNEFGMPVILLTAKGEPRDRLEGLELGAADYIAKPFHPKEVVLRLNKVLRVS
ncbi:MAG: response regulator, partial [Nakamurella sp.]